MADSNDEMTWAEPPSKPIRYGLRARLEDIYNGRKDGRRQLPLVVLPLELDHAQSGEARPNGGEASSIGQGPAETSIEPALVDEEPAEPSAQPVEPGAGSHAQPLVPEIHLTTAHWHKLGSLGRELIAAERIAWLKASQTRQGEFARLRGVEAEFIDEVETVRQELEQASKQPDDVELKDRRIAESDPAKQRPDRLVRDRRLREHRERLARVEERYRRLVADMVHAKQAADALEIELAVDAAIARSRAQRAAEHVNRRIATYWQHLIRFHRYGEYLNEALPQVRPELPDWATEPLRQSLPQPSSEPTETGPEVPQPHKDESDPSEE
jgi:hypothetical protein